MTLGEKEKQSKDKTCEVVGNTSGLIPRCFHAGKIVGEEAVMQGQQQCAGEQHSQQVRGRAWAEEDVVQRRRKNRPEVDQHKENAYVAWKRAGQY